jgi:hypothetical protein
MVIFFFISPYNNSDKQDTCVNEIILKANKLDRTACFADKCVYEIISKNLEMISIALPQNRDKCVNETISRKHKQIVSIALPRKRDKCTHETVSAETISTALKKHAG